MGGPFMWEWEPTPDQVKLFDEWKDYCVGYLVSCQGGVNIQSMTELLAEKTGERIPLAKMGFRTINQFLYEILMLEGCVDFRTLDGQYFVFITEARVPEYLAHIRKEVLGQATDPTSKRRNGKILRPTKAQSHYVNPSKIIDLVQDVISIPDDKYQLSKQTLAAVTPNPVDSMPSADAKMETAVAALNLTLVPAKPILACIKPVPPTTKQPPAALKSGRPSTQTEQAAMSRTPPANIPIPTSNKPTPACAILTPTGPPRKKGNRNRRSSVGRSLASSITGANSSQGQPVKPTPTVSKQLKKNPEVKNLLQEAIERLNKEAEDKENRKDGTLSRNAAPPKAQLDPSSELTVSVLPPLVNSLRPPSPEASNRCSGQTEGTDCLEEKIQRLTAKEIQISNPMGANPTVAQTRASPVEFLLDSVSISSSSRAEELNWTDSSDEEWDRLWRQRVAIATDDQMPSVTVPAVTHVSDAPPNPQINFPSDENGTSKSFDNGTKSPIEQPHEASLGDGRLWETAPSCLTLDASCAFTQMLNDAMSGRCVELWDSSRSDFEINLDRILTTESSKRRAMF